MWDDGDEYVGQFVNGLKCGFGIYNYADFQTRFCGFWDEDVKKGYGIDISHTTNEVLRGIWADKDLIIPDSTFESGPETGTKRPKTSYWSHFIN